MDAEIGFAVVSIIFAIILYIGLIALMMFLTYLIIKWAINHSRLNEHLMAIRQELHVLNARLHASGQTGTTGANETATNESAGAGNAGVGETGSAGTNETGINVQQNG